MNEGRWAVTQDYTARCFWCEWSNPYVTETKAYAAMVAHLGFCHGRPLTFNHQALNLLEEWLESWDKDARFNAITEALSGD